MLSLSHDDRMHIYRSLGTLFTSQATSMDCRTASLSYLQTCLAAERSIINWNAMPSTHLSSQLAKALLDYADEVVMQSAMAWGICVTGLALSVQCLESLISRDKTVLMTSQQVCKVTLTTKTMQNEDTNVR